MIYIAHRGLFQGPSKELENHPGQIALAIEQGYNVEIDIRYIDGKLVLGHDYPEYEVDEYWLRNDKLWIHCKNLEALYFFTKHPWKYNFFWHENDQYTLTSFGFIWTFPGKYLTDQSIMVVPEFYDATLECTQNVTCYGICSDYVEKIRILRNETNSMR